MSELFPVESVTKDSPRLAWMKRHGIITYHFAGLQEPGDWLAGSPSEDTPPFKEPVDFFANETAHYGDSRIGCGDTEEDAIADFAGNAGIPLWNEEKET